MNAPPINHLTAMSPVRHRLLKTVLMACLIWLPAKLAAQPADAPAVETAWFAGEWTVSPAPVEGFEDIAAELQGTVRIEHLGGARLIRHSPAKNGRPAASVAYTVKKLGATHPWWPVEGGLGVIARRVTKDAFDLAMIGPTGRADWKRAWRHSRVSSACIVNGAKTGKIGEGKVFISPVDDVIRIRTEGSGGTTI